MGGTACAWAAAAAFAADKSREVLEPRVSRVRVGGGVGAAGVTGFAGAGGVGAGAGAAGAAASGRGTRR